MMAFFGPTWTFDVLINSFFPGEKSLHPHLSAARQASLTAWLLMRASSVFTPLNLKSAILTDSWLKTEPAPQQQQQQHQEEPRPRHPHPPPPPLPLPPTTTSMSPKSDDLVASAPLLSPFPPPWRWELATISIFLSSLSNPCPSTLSSLSHHDPHPSTPASP